MVQATVKEAIEILRKAVISESESDAIRFTLCITYHEIHTEWDRRTVESLEADGVSMRNICGAFIK